MTRGVIRAGRERCRSRVTCRVRIGFDEFRGAPAGVVYVKRRIQVGELHSLNTL